MLFREPNFFLVGAPKAGTTALHSCLGQHPQVFMCPIKEPNFFAPEIGVENVSAQMRPRMQRKTRAMKEYAGAQAPSEVELDEPSRGWLGYLRLFRAASQEIAIGESSAVYLWSLTAARNIAARIPHAKIIISLRNPIDRAFSQYLQLLGAGLVRHSFREQIKADLRCQDRRIGVAWPLLEVGQYCMQVRRYLACFPRSQVHIIYYEDFAQNPREVLYALYSFLGVHPDFVPDVSQRHNAPQILRLNTLVYLLKKSGAWQGLRSSVPAALRLRLRSGLLRPRESLRIEPADRAYLAEYYRDDIAQLESLLGRDLAAWR